VDLPKNTKNYERKVARLRVGCHYSRYNLRWQIEQAMSTMASPKTRSAESPLPRQLDEHGRCYRGIPLKCGPTWPNGEETLGKFPTPLDKFHTSETPAIVDEFGG